MKITTILNPCEAEACDECGEVAATLDVDAGGVSAYICTGCLRNWRDTITEALNTNP